VGYAEDTASEYADRIFHKTGHQIRREAGKLIEKKKDKASGSSTSEEPVYQPKEQIRPVPPSGGETAQEQGKELAVKKIKTIERDKRTIKTGRASEQVVKNTGKDTIKTSGKAVKTAEQTAQNTRIVVKTTAKAVTHAIKALMEATKGSFNIKYPRQPNGITDPEYSISFGVQEIKSCLERAGVKNPLDMENIKLALQSYNYGNGYLEWAKARGGYTLANAAEFSDMMAQRMGWSSYGDKQYVPHVLQYYAFGRIPTGIGNQAIVQVAASQEGKGGTTYWSWYGFGSRVEWCACFVSWCADQSGYIQSGVIPKFSLCSDGVRWFESKGRFRDSSYTSAAGDIIFFDWGNNGTIDHVGIVESVSGGTVNTIEGNSGDKVARRSYSIESSNIYGYGVPAY
jgi:hypothetical protein